MVNVVFILNGSRETNLHPLHDLLHVSELLLSVLQSLLVPHLHLGDHFLHRDTQ